MTKHQQEYFPIARLSRADLVGQILNGHKLTEGEADALTDDQMARIADKMGNAYLEQNYWIDLGIIVEYVLEDAYPPTRPARAS